MKDRVPQVRVEQERDGVGTSVGKEGPRCKEDNLLRRSLVRDPRLEAHTRDDTSTVTKIHESHPSRPFVPTHMCLTYTYIYTHVHVGVTYALLTVDTHPPS